jgi:hypothetical protein
VAACEPNAIVKAWPSVAFSDRRPGVTFVNMETTRVEG